MLSIHFKKYIIFLFAIATHLACAKDIAGTSDEVYQNRISALKLQFEVPYNPIIKTYIEEYLSKPDLTKNLILASKFCFPQIEKHLKAKNAPVELKYLAANASLLDPGSTNTSGASGIWMMAYPVSKMYKLKVTNYVDERKDIAKSSIVAAQHFKDLNSIYKSWSLAIAAYGCSPVMLNKCIRMAGNSLFFWDIYNVMPTFCRDLLPKTIATAYILNYYKEHGIKVRDSEILFESSDSVTVYKWLSFQQISNTLNIPVEELRFLNPIFKKDVIPYSSEGFVVKLPKGKAKDFYLLKDSFFKADPETFINTEPVEIKKDNTRNQNSAEKPNETDVKKAIVASKTTVTYKVKSGDNLGKIANWFDTTIPEIKKKNKLISNNVKRGKILKIDVPVNKKIYYQKINNMSQAQKKRLENKN